MFTSLLLAVAVCVSAGDCSDGKCQVKQPLVAIKVGPVKVEVGGGKVKYKRCKACKCNGCKCKAAKR